MIAVLACLLTLGGDAKPLPNAHAHNDYRHERPLLDALDRGFTSVEADVFLVDGELRVGHDRSELRPGRTLESLYLDPLLERSKRNRGHIYPQPARFILLVDIKADGEKVYERLRNTLPKYREMLTEYIEGAVKVRPVTLILSGERPTEILAKEKSRLAFIDGRLPDLERNPSSELVPLVSDNWTTTFRYSGDAMPPHEVARLKQMVAAAHSQGRLIRFWAVPDRAEYWKLLREAKVDLINTDRLDALADFLRKAEG